MNLQDLQPREKKMLIGGAIAFVVFVILLIQALSGGGAEQQTNLRKIEHERDEFMQDLAEYKKIYSTVEEIDRGLQRTPSDYDLYGKLSGMVEELGMRESIRNLTPHQAGGTDYYTESYVDMDLKEIKLDDLVELMKSIEAQEEFVKITQLSVKRRFSDERNLDVNMRVAAFAEKE